MTADNFSQGDDAYECNRKADILLKMIADTVPPEPERISILDEKDIKNLQLLPRSTAMCSTNIDGEVRHELTTKIMNMRTLS